MSVKRKLGRAYILRGAITRKKIKKQKGSSAPSGGSGKAWFEVLHCSNGMCYELHPQVKVDGRR